MIESDRLDYAYAGCHAFALELSRRSTYGCPSDCNPGTNSHKVDLSSWRRIIVRYFRLTFAASEQCFAVPHLFRTETRMGTIIWSLCRAQHENHPHSVFHIRSDHQYFLSLTFLMYIVLFMPLCKFARVYCYPEWALRPAQTWLRRVINNYVFGFQSPVTRQQWCRWLDLLQLYSDSGYSHSYYNLTTTGIANYRPGRVWVRSITPNGWQIAGFWPPQKS